MTDELKSLIEDAAKLLGINGYWFPELDRTEFLYTDGVQKQFNPCDPERGDLMKVAMAAELCIELEFDYVVDPVGNVYGFTKGDHQSFAYAVLRAASAVLKSRGGE
jgi:hypothetical protein